MPTTEADLKQAAAVLRHLAAARIELTVQGTDLRVSAPKGALSDADRSQIREHKSALIQLLQDQAGSETSAIARTSRDRPGLSPLQERFWLLEKIESIGAANNVPIVLRFEGEVDRGALVRSLQTVIERHEALRTRIGTEAGQSFQIIEATLDPAWLGYADLSSLSEDACDAAAAERIEAVLQAPFDLDAGPLIRGELIELKPTECLLLIAIHHLITDGWSMDLFVAELRALYNADVAGEPCPLPPLSVQYADYAVWARQQMESPAILKQLEYWQEHLRDAPATLDVPTDFPRPAVQSFRGASFRFAYPNELLGALKGLAGREGATLYIILLAALQAFLGRLARQDDVIVGSPITNRPLPELEKLIGFFVNTLAFRADLAGAPSFHALLEQVKRVAIQAYANQDVPFEALVAAVRPIRDRSRSVLQVMLSLHNEPHRQPQFTGLSAHVDFVQTATAKSDLSFNFRETADGLLGRIEYATDLFTEASIQDIASRFKLFLQGIVADPDTPITRLPVTTDDERRQLIEWGAVDRVLHADRRIEGQPLQKLVGAVAAPPQAQLERAYVLGPDLQLLPPSWPGEIYLEWAPSAASPDPADPQWLASPFHPGRWLSRSGAVAAWQPGGRLNLMTQDGNSGPVPDGPATPGDQGSNALETPMEEMLARLWAEALQLEQVKPSDNFFTLGGHSIMGIEMIAQIFEQTGTAVPVKILFETQSLREMAAYVEREMEPSA